MEQKEINDVISQTSIFRGLNEIQKTQLAKICFFRIYQTGDIIINEGDSGDGFYIIIEGKLTVFLPKHSDSGKKRFSQVKLNTLVAGNYFGEYSLIDQHPVSATIEALEKTSILKMNETDFQKVLYKDLNMTKTIYHNLLKLSISRLRKNDEQLDSFLIS